MVTLGANYKPIATIFENSAYTSKKTQHFTITNIGCLLLFMEIVAVFTENYVKPFIIKGKSC
jgi:phage regulator Rha-like protein